MISDPPEIHKLDELRKFVQQSICEYHCLEAAAAPITERTLVRSGKPCGIFFCVQGPRSVKFTAIWDRDKNSVLFYNSTGERLHRTKVSFVPNF